MSCFSKYAALLFVSLMTASSCAKDKNQPSPEQKPPQASAGSLTGLPFVVLRDAGLEITEGQISGDGVLLFTAPLPDAKGQRFQLSFSLADGGDVSLVTYANDKLEQGIVSSFHRSGTGASASIGSDNGLALHSFDLAGIDGAAPLSVDVDISNHQESAHVVIRRSGEEASLWDSKTAPLDVLKGAGLHWGLSLNKAAVTAVALMTPETNGDDHDDHTAPTSFTVTDLLQTARKATTRFERLAIPNSSFQSVKTWKSETYAWARLTYKITPANGPATEEQLFLACHFHGTELGCHKKDRSDPSEPTDTPPSDDLPPIDDELPPLE